MHIINTTTKNENKSMERETELTEATTPVGRMFHHRSVFITGASGFIGRVLLEKLLRSYEGIKNIYIVMRTKKNQNPLDRLHKQLLKAPIFDAIRAKPNGSNLLSKIIVIPGDIGEPNLGISDEDMNLMLNDKTLSIVFHSAATIKFDEPLKVSVRLNLIATKTIIEFCKRLPNLISVCHVSTAYVNSDQEDGKPIYEQLYPMKDKPEDLITMAQIMDENLMQTLKTSLVDQRPNTYTYTKALTEHMIDKEATDLPIAIVRPTIVVAAWRQPLPGWVDNLNGPTGLILAIGKGLLRSLNVVHSGVADCVPVDVVVNTMIASAFHVAVINNKLMLDGSSAVDLNENGRLVNNKKIMNTINEEEFDLIKSSCTTIQDEKIENGAIGGKKLKLDEASKLDNNQAEKRVKLPKYDNDNDDDDDDDDNEQTKVKQLPIIHCNTGVLNPITWGEMEKLFFPVIRKYPSCQVLRYPYGTFKSNYYHDLIARIIAHYLPALIIDFLCVLMGKKRQLLSVYNKLHSATAALSHFTMHSYHFKSNNMKLIQANLSEEDRQDLYMDLEHLDWLSFWDDYVHGARKFVLKEEDHTLPEARKSFARAYYIEMCLRVLLAISGLLLFTYLGSTNVVRAAVQKFNVCCF